MKSMHYLITVFTAFFLSLSVCASGLIKEEIQRFKPESQELKQISDGLRMVVEKELKKPVLFRIDTLKAQGKWAFLLGMPLQKSGKPMNYQGTPYQEFIADDTFDDWICALLRKEGNQWKVVTYVIGATDVPYANWAQTYHAPPELFK